MRMYYRLVITASVPATNVWLGDDEGHLVQAEVGELDTNLMPGKYVVEFGLGTQTYPIELVAPRRYAQSEVEAGPICARPIPHFATDNEP